MYFSHTLLSTILFLSSSALADSLSASAVPDICKTLCQPFTDISTACSLRSSTPSGNDALAALDIRQDAAECVCTQDPVQAAGKAAVCFGCVQEYGDASKLGESPSTTNTTDCTLMKT